MCTTKGINRKEVMADQTTICKSLNSYNLLDGEVIAITSEKV